MLFLAASLCICVDMPVLLQELRIVAKPDQSVKLFVDFIDAEAATVAKDLITVGY
jgi:hypothetical protein